MRRLVGAGGPASGTGRVQQSVIGRAGAIGREGAMLDTCTTSEALYVVTVLEPGGLGLAATTVV